MAYRLLGFLLSGLLVLGPAVARPPAAGPVVFNVLDYGARASPTVSSQAAIQRAIEACARAGGGQVLVPAGVCNAFQSLSEQGTQYVYCFTDEWRPGMAGIAFTPLDEGLGVEWPIAIDVEDGSQISAKDAGAPKFSEWKAAG